MKKNVLKWLFMMALVPLMFVMSCNPDDKEDEVDLFLPVLDENFSFSVTGNDVMFSTTINGNVWVTTDGVDYPFVDKAVTVNLPLAGTYTFTCNSLGSGVKKSSAEFTVTIAQDDLGFLQEPEWKSLTGGSKKSWVLDLEGKVVEGPLSFYLTSWDFVEGKYSNDDTWYWTPDPGWTFANAMATPGDDGYGVMTFDATNGFKFSAEKTLEDDENGTFFFDYDNRLITLSGATILRSYKPNAQVKVDPTCTGDDCEMKSVDGMEGISDWSNYHILELTDTLLRVAVIRDQDVQGEGEIYLVYNFVAKDIYESIVIEIVEATVEWPVAPTAVETNDASASSKFSGSWKVKASPTWNSWYAGFWNFSTGTNDAPDIYMGTNQEGNVYWGSYSPGETDTWAMPSDSLQNLTMTFDATNLTFSIKKADNTEVASGTFKTDGNKITTAGAYLINTEHQSKTQHSPFTAVIASITDSPVAGDELKVAFYQCDASCAKNEWISYTYIKQ